jgi:hypothetical protein
VLGKFVQDVRRQAAAFRPEHQHVAGTEARLGIEATGLGGEGMPVAARQRRTHCLPVLVHGEVGQFVIVEARAAHGFLVQRETQRPDQVQTAAAVGGEADDVARIAGNFRLKKNDVKHALELE